MKKTQVVGSIGDFLRGCPKEETKWAQVERHFKKYGTYYRIAGVTVIVLLTGSHAFAAGSVEDGARVLYYELVRIGKWVIIFKGGIDTIKAAGSGDFETARKSFFSHVLIYMLLFGLPYAIDKTDAVLKKMMHA